MSEMDDMDDSATSFSDSNVKRLMPNFWLIMQVNNDCVNIFFQNRLVSYGGCFHSCVEVFCFYSQKVLRVF